MSSSTHESGAVSAVAVEVNDESLIVNLNDGRVLSVPLAWFPRLVHATAEERQDWMLMGGGQGIHWRRLDEDINVAGLMAGVPSCERPESLKRWFEKRKQYRIPLAGS